MENYYKVLNVNQRACDQDIRQAYKKLALKFHPDKNKNVGTEEKFKLILKAHNILIDPVERPKFDKKLKDYRSQCCKCSAIFTNSNDLTKHSEKYHPRQFRCVFCSSIAYFETSKDLIKHVSQFHQFKCDMCQTSFGKIEDLSRHKFKFHPAILPFECKFCTSIEKSTFMPTSFKTSEELIKHVSKFHPFNCEKCSFSFGKIEDLAHHKFSFHPPVTNAFSNFRFGKTTSTKTGSSAPAPAKTGEFSFGGEASTGNDGFKFGESSSNTKTASKSGPESAFTFGGASQPKPTFWGAPKPKPTFGGASQPKPNFGGAKPGAKPSFFSFGGGAAASAASKTKPAQQYQSSNLKCKLCYWLIFSNDSQLKQHNDYIHPKPFKCDKCSFSFFDKLDDLNLHIERFHPKKFQSFFSFRGGATASTTSNTKPTQQPQSSNSFAFGGGAGGAAHSNTPQPAQAGVFQFGAAPRKPSFGAEPFTFGGPFQPKPTFGGASQPKPTFVGAELSAKTSTFSFVEQEHFDEEMNEVCEEEYAKDTEEGISDEDL